MRFRQLLLLLSANLVLFVQTSLGFGQTSDVPAKPFRPVVFRAGNLPTGLPSWFEILDHDKDAQVSLYEWRIGGKPLKEFPVIDRNNDGLVTIEEAVRYAARPGDPRAEIGGAIDAILYSDMTKDQMLIKLKPYVSLLETKIGFEKKTGLQLFEGIGTGPGIVHDYGVSHCGLRLIIAHDEIRIIQRSARTRGNKTYPFMSLSAPIVRVKGYVRIYDN
jgi:hypothetical protein